MAQEPPPPPGPYIQPGALVILFLGKGEGGVQAAEQKVAGSIPGCGKDEEELQGSLRQCGVLANDALMITDVLMNGE